MDMPLSALNFGQPEDFNQFINRLLALGYVDVNGQASLQNKLLQADNQKIYFLDDVQEFLQTASDEEIQSSQIIFQTAQNEPVTLAQMKTEIFAEKDSPKPNRFSSLLQKLSLGLFSSSDKAEADAYYEKLQYINKYSELIEHLSIGLFSFSPNLSWYSASDVKLSKNEYQNDAFYNAIDVNQMITSFVSSLNLASSDKVPSPVNPNEGIDWITKDLLKVTCIQESKLKKHLQNERMKTRDELTLFEIDRWIKEINSHQSQTKKLLVEIREAAQEQLNRINSAHLIYQSHLAEDPEFVKANQKIADLKKKRAALEASLEWREFLCELVVFLALILGVILLVFVLPALIALIVFIMVLFIPDIILFPILITFAIFGIAWLMFLTVAEPIANNFRLAYGPSSDSQPLGEVVDKLVRGWVQGLLSMEEISSILHETTAQIQSIQDEISFINQYAQVADEEFFAPQYVALIETMQSDIEEIEAFGPIEILESPPNKQESLLDTQFYQNVLVPIGSAIKNMVVTAWQGSGQNYSSRTADTSVTDVGLFRVKEREVPQYEAPVQEELPPPYESP